MGDKPHLSIRIDIGDGRFGPGKAALLRAIVDAGSISGAARALGMSYRRAWGLVDEMNEMFSSPLVETKTGGHDKGGARLTADGRAVLTYYDAVIAEARRGAAKPLSQMRRLVATGPR